LNKVAEHVPPMAQRLAQRFWPGGLTLVVRARASLPANLRAQTNTIGVRLPDSATVRELVRGLGSPLAATSANLSGGANPQTAEEVMAALGGRIALILDGGATPGNLPSTVLDCTGQAPRILRAGAIAVSEIEDELGMHIEGVPE
jgi:L-threonylcarbamoyladenylate synthase